MHMALRAMITVKDCESMRVLRSQSRNGVLTIAAFISGHPSPSITLEMAKGCSLYMVKAVMNGRADEVVDLAKTNLWR